MTLIFGTNASIPSATHCAAPQCRFSRALCKRPATAYVRAVFPGQGVEAIASSNVPHSACAGGQNTLAFDGGTGSRPAPRENLRFRGNLYTLLSLRSEHMEGTIQRDYANLAFLRVLGCARERRDTSRGGRDTSNKYNPAVWCPPCSQRSDKNVVPGLREMAFLRRKSHSVETCRSRKYQSL